MQALINLGIMLGLISIMVVPHVIFRLRDIRKEKADD